MPGNRNDTYSGGKTLVAMIKRIAPVGMLWNRTKKNAQLSNAIPIKRATNSNLSLLRIHLERSRPLSDHLVAKNESKK